MNKCFRILPENSQRHPDFLQYLILAKSITRDTHQLTKGNVIRLDGLTLESLSPRLEAGPLPFGKPWSILESQGAPLANLLKVMDNAGAGHQ